MNYRPVISNKQARFNYEILETFIAGIVLTGTEIKSIRLGKVNIQDGHCHFQNDELFIFNMTIQPYEFGNMQNVEVNRIRKLLLTKMELKRLKEKVQEKGLTIVPLKLFFSDKNIAKLEIGLAKGKKLYDKRNSIKEKDIKRDLERNVN